MTLHVRMVSPPDLTELLADALMADSDVSNLEVLTGSARRPDGDAVHFDVLARSANSVLGKYRRLSAITATRSSSRTWTRRSGKNSARPRNYV